MRILLAVTCALALLGFVGCGESEEVLPQQDISLEQYFERFMAARDRAEARVGEDPSDGDFASEEGQAYFRLAAEILRDWRAEVSAIDPPSEVRAGHDSSWLRSREASNYWNPCSPEQPKPNHR